MTKPTLLQTILNRPTQSYSSKHPQENPSRQDTLRLAAEKVQSSSQSQSDLGSTLTGYYSISPGKDDFNLGATAVSPTSSTMGIQGTSMPHVPSSHASHSTATPSVSASTATLTAPAPPPLPPKDRLLPAPIPRPERSRNISSKPDSASQQQRQADTTTFNLSPGALSPNGFFNEDSDEDDNESTQDVFYTPNSSPRASLTSTVTISSMAYVASAPATVRKVSRRALRDNVATLDRSPPHHQTNPSPKADNNKSPKPTQPSPSSTKAKPAASDSPPRGQGSGNIPTESTPSHSPSTRIAVLSTRTPSRSNSLNKGRPTFEARSGPSSGSAGSTGQGIQGQSQAQGRAKATVSMASSGSSMSSNSLDGHSVIFSDLVTETTRATTASPGGNGAVGKSPKKGQGPAASDATKRWVDKTASDAAKATTTPMNLHSPSAPSASTTISHPRKRPNKAQTYHGLGISSPTPNTNSSNTSALANPTLYQQYQYSQYQRNRDNKNAGVMMSMTAVLEAAEQEELYRYEKKNGGAGTSAWKARQLLKQHQNAGKNSVVGVVNPRAGGEASADPKGKGKEKVDITVGSVSGGGNRNRSMANGGTLNKGKGKEREHPSVIYTKHQPLTSSPLAMSSKPLPAPAASPPPPRNNSFREVSNILSRPILGRRRSRSLGTEQMPRYQLSESPSPYRTPSPPGTSASHMQQDLYRTGGHSRAYSLSRSPGESSSILSTTTATVDLSAHPQSSGELPSKGMPGFTSLVLPRAPPPLNLHDDARNNGFGEGKVDLTKDGLAQTTMASVEVVRGLGGTAGRKPGLMGMLPLVRRKTIPVKSGLGVGTSSPSEMKTEDDEIGGRAVGVLNGATSVLGFTSHRKPPEYVPSGSVLVQVWAVGVDGIDGRLIGVRTAQGGGNSPAPPSPAVSASTDQDQGTGDSPRTNGAEFPERENEAEGQAAKSKSKDTGLGRSLSLRERLSRSVSLGRSAGRRFERTPPNNPQPSTPIRSATLSYSPEKLEKHASPSAGATALPVIGYIPGRSFVGRVVECGWEVRDEVVRKGDWVAGLLDIKKPGALTEFIVVDRHRIHRVPHPKLSPGPERAISALIFSTSPSTPSLPQHTLTLEELALLPLCGLPAYRAVRTFMYAFTSMRDNPSISSVGRNSDMAKHRPAGHDPNKPLDFATYGATVSRLNLGDHEHGRRRRALVLRGHDGIGAIAVQMLVLRGWRVCVHVPFIASPPNTPTTSAIADAFMEEVEERIRKWGAEEVIFDDGEVIGMDEGRGAVVRVINGLREDGDAFDAVLDTIGGKEVRDAAERLLRSPGRRANTDESLNGGSKNSRHSTKGTGQFTTVVGDNPERVIPSAGDLFRAGIRSLKFGSGGGASSSISASEKASSENVSSRNNDTKGSKVGYAWINISQDVDWEGRDVGETIGSLVELGLEYGIKPWVGAEYATVNGAGPNRNDTPPLMAEPSSSYQEKGITTQGLESTHWEGSRIVPFEKAPDVFVCGGPLTSGGTVVVRIAT
ncbi:hypothetical protein D9756_000884 [Leucocoprinus leucothites]|uniref:Uncharacterized protein n=1 Tax=Leucocoprinus leucothites TaxID=201217 RepID=A0A8H5GF17_9AGAR|nr:hypothetical protein D9756_000884 [Leucoagaricus leucothites]